MSKVQKSYRLDENALTKLDELVTEYAKIISKTSGFDIKISTATVLELLVTEKYEEIKGGKKNENAESIK